MVAFADADGLVVLTLDENGALARTALGQAEPTQVIARDRASGGLWLVRHAGQPCVVTITSDHIVEVLSAVDGRPVGLPAISIGDGQILTAANVGQRTLIAFANDEPAGVSVWDLEAGAVFGSPMLLATQFPGRQPVPVWAAAITERDGQPVVLCGSSSRGPAFTWDPRQGKLLGGPFYGGAVLSALITSDGGRELQWWGSTSGDLHVRPGDDGTVRPIAAHDNGIDALAACRPAGRLAVITGSRDGAVRVWRPEDLLSAASPRPGIASLEVLPPAGDSGPLLVTALLTDGTASVFEADDGHVVTQLRPPGPGIRLAEIALLPGPGVGLLTVDSEHHVAAWHPAGDQLEPMWRLPEDCRMWNIAVAGGDQPTLLVAQTDGLVSFFDAATGRPTREPLDLKCRDKRYKIIAGPVAADGSIRFFVYASEAHDVSEWTLSPALVACRTLVTPPSSEPYLEGPSALAFTTLDDIPVVVGVGPYSAIYMWNARDCSLQNSVWLEQAHQMVLLAVDVAELGGQPTVLCGGFTCSLAMWRPDTRSEHHLRVGSVLTQVRSTPGGRVAISGIRGIMMVHLTAHLPGRRVPRHMPQSASPL
jgi:WD40 repeat protein